MYHIAILIDQKGAGQKYAEQVTRFCADRGLFPQVELHYDPEQFFSGILRERPSSVILALPGVAGLNAAEHLRSICPDCGVIWCSDLDFSLHAYRLRVDYFILEPVADELLLDSLNVLFETHMKQSTRRTIQ